MMEKFTENLTKVEEYKLSSGRYAEKLRPHIGETMRVIAYMNVENAVLTIMDENKNVYGTNSPSFISDFRKIVDIFGCPVTIRVASEVSKNGREYMYAIPVDD